MKILVKFPTRERPDKSLSTLNGYIENAYSNEQIIYLLSYDVDDYKMNDEPVLEKFRSLHPNVILSPGKSINKVHAYNRDIYKVPEWDILVAASDDMICVKTHWDKIIEGKFLYHFPDLDGVLHFNDGYAGEKLNTLPIIGRVYYERFKYVYNPKYKSLWCDNEFMEVAQGLKKQAYINDILFKHEHYANNPSVEKDKLMTRTESFYHQDKKVYEQRKKLNFK